jgi:hypothetical protein
VSHNKFRQETCSAVKRLLCANISGSSFICLVFGAHGPKIKKREQEDHDQLKWSALGEIARESERLYLFNDLPARCMPKGSRPNAPPAAATRRRKFSSVNTNSSHQWRLLHLGRRGARCGINARRVGCRRRRRGGLNPPE